MSLTYNTMIGWFITYTMPRRTEVTDTVKVCPINRNHGLQHLDTHFCPTCGNALIKEDLKEVVTLDFVYALDHAKTRSDKKFLEQFLPYSSEAIAGLAEDEQFLFYEGIAVDPTDEDEKLQDINVPKLMAKKPNKEIIARLTKLTGAKKMKVRFGTATAIY